MKFRKTKIFRKKSTRNGDPELHQNRSHGPKARQVTKSRLEALCSENLIKRPTPRGGVYVLNIKLVHNSDGFLRSKSLVQ